MKEVKKCSISGVAFTMDADAYEALETYLESLKTTYKDTADGAEIVADIEARIAELGQLECFLQALALYHLGSHRVHPVP